MNKYLQKVRSRVRKRQLRPRLRLPWMTWQEMLRLRQRLLLKLRRAKT